MKEQLFHKLDCLLFTHTFLIKNDLNVNFVLTAIIRQFDSYTEEDHSHLANYSQRNYISLDHPQKLYGKLSDWSPIAMYTDFRLAMHHYIGRSSQVSHTADMDILRDYFQVLFRPGRRRGILTPKDRRASVRLHLLLNQ